MSKTPAPKEGCFKATHPSTTWEETACTAAPDRPLGPSTAAGALGVGGGGDYLADAPGPISWAEGSFPSVTGVTSEIDSYTNTPNDYTLQLNSNFLNYNAALGSASPAPLCSGAEDPSSCEGWEQFVYAPGVAFIQYWLINYGNPCPAGWNTPQAPWQNDCFRNSSTGVSVPPQPITNLAQLTLSGGAGSTDRAVVTTGDNTIYVVQQASIMNLDAGWSSAEFNLFGGGNGSEALLNPGARIVVEIQTDVPSSTSAPSCGTGSYTAESANLSLVPDSCSSFGGQPSGVEFTESNGHGFMILSDTNSGLAVNAWGGAANGTVLRLADNCTASNPDCTWSFQDGMLVSDRDPTLAINAYGGAAQGTVLRLVNNCTPLIPDCTWTYRHGEFLSDTNPSLAINAYGGAAAGTTLKLVNNCNSGLSDCTWSLPGLMFSSRTNTTLNVNAYGGAANDISLKLVNNCGMGLSDCTWSFHQGMIASDTNASLAVNAYGGPANLNPVEIVDNCSSDIGACTWTWSHGELISDSSPPAAPLVVNAYGGAASGTSLRIVNNCNPDLFDCVFEGLFAR